MKEYIINRGLYSTDIERIMKKSLEQNKIDFVPEFPIRGSYIIDFAIPDLKIAIECDGKIWHKDKSKDKIRDYWLKKKGWTILRFTDKEIKKNINSCILIIMGVMKNDKDKSKSERNCTIINE